MKILHIAFYYFPRVGVATWSTFALSKRLASRHECILIVPNIKYDVALSDEEVMETQALNPTKLYKTPFFRIPIKWAPIISPIFLLFKALKVSRDADIVLCHFQPHHFTFLVGLLVGKILGIPVVARAEDIQRDMGDNPTSFFQWLNRNRRAFYNWINESFIKYTDAFLVVCPENLEILESRIGPLKNIHVHYNGVDPLEFVGSDYEDARRQLGIKPNQKVILFIGRFSGPEYRIEVLLDAVSLLQDSNILLFLVGYQLPNRFVDILPLKTCVVGQTLRDGVKNYLAASDICIGPLGATKAIPSKVLEYMACEKPIITGIESVSRVLAVDGKNCLLVQPEAKAVASEINKLIQNKDLSRNLALNAKMSINGFAWDKLAVQLEEIMEAIL